MTNLKSINGMNQYCGPAVLAALTGRSTDECASVISRVNGKDVIKAVQMNHILQALDLLGFSSTRIEWTGITLFGTLGTLSRNPGFYIVLVPKHVVAVEVTSDCKVYLIDNHTKEPINAGGSARLSQHVEGVYLVKEKPPLIKPILLKSEIKVTNDGMFVIIRMLNYFESVDQVSQTIRLGQFSYSNEEQLTQIIDAVSALRKTPIEEKSSTSPDSDDSRISGSTELHSIIVSKCD